MYLPLVYDLAVDLGTSNTLINLSGKGVIVREPTVIARKKKSKELLAVGMEAKKMLGKNPEAIEVVQPIKGGVIADFDATAVMLKHYFEQISQHIGWLPRLLRPRVVAGIPGGLTEVEKRAVQDAALSAGARRALLVEGPLAAALGAGIEVIRPDGHLVVDIGGGTTEIAVISLSGIVVNRSLRVAGQTMDQAIVKAVRLSRGLLLGEATAEEVKINIGSAATLEKEKIFVVRGRDIGKGLPRSLKLKSAEIREVLAPIIQEITAAVADILEETPPELVGDILQHGIILCGAAGLMPGIDQVIAEATKMPVGITEAPQDAVVRGLAKLLANARLLEMVRLKRGLS
ncbi:rod shape-determining protein [Candidatus Beckwithbacteria bacterium CG23_combo_of_CG06-09_8_20_14_all_47_9]|uniref:Cell shape-determining protein MreB n=1 Tax=Candidatus Beckwithbacteria bacterium CG23_combo_of_CG06-09_8_20_14_all_47_9 TaxID=1974498 RepID=A0A2H0B3L2_9BACT|nr:MAG: rod shape-determining protein [Candidatus Beckwithbacteria bacterium CG23_combo_of_CG06-09_8_20_14_all_47_9]